MLDKKIMGENIANSIIDPKATEDIKQNIIEIWEKISNEIILQLVNNAEIGNLKGSKIKLMIENKEVEAEIISDLKLSIK